ncbi:hypothetical protein [Methanobrevibacter filiformis]
MDILIITKDKNKIKHKVYKKVSEFLLKTMEYISVKIKKTMIGINILLFI